MNINSDLKEILLKNIELKDAILNLDAIESNEAYFLEIFMLIKKFGIHPKLITLLLIKLQLSDKNYSFEILEQTMYSSLYNSTDCELLLEFYFFIENVLQEKSDEKSNILIKSKIIEIQKNLDEINEKKDTL